MRLRNHCHISGGIGQEANCWISSLNSFRKLSVVPSSYANPMMANWSVSSFADARLHSAGISLRLVKSPLAPKMTMTQGSAWRVEAGVFSADAEAFIRSGLSCGDYHRPDPAA